MNPLDIHGVQGQPIHGVYIKELATIPDERGAIMHMLRRDDPLFKEFGEIYFSKAYPGVIKGWHLHTQMTLNYAPVNGQIKIVLFDGREGSPTKGNIMEIFTGEDWRLLVQVPPYVWNGYKTIGTEPSLIANCATMPYTPGEMKRLNPYTDKIPYSWHLVQK